MDSAKTSLSFAFILMVLLFFNQWGVENQLISEIRLSRFLLLMAVGAGLSVAGVALQSLFFNPLCDPYILGVSSAGALGAVLGAHLGWSVLGVNLPAFLGALLGVGILFLSHRFGRMGQLSLLLVGVMQGFVFSSFLALWMSLADPMGVYGAVSWLLGNVQYVSSFEGLVVLLVILFLILLIYLKRNDLDLLLLGEDQARIMGCEIHRLRMYLVIVSSFIVAICVSYAGMIGFIGLVIPHLVRYQTSSLHTRLIPLSAFVGGVALNSADTIGRLTFPHSEIPLGAICAIMGAPILIWILIRFRWDRDEIHVRTS